MSCSLALPVLLFDVINEIPPVFPIDILYYTTNKQANQSKRRVRYFSLAFYSFVLLGFFAVFAIFFFATILREPNKTACACRNSKDYCHDGHDESVSIYSAYNEIGVSYLLQYIVCNRTNRKFGSVTERFIKTDATWNRLRWLHT